MGVWRSFKSWVKRTVLRIALRFARTRFIRYLRKIVRASLVPLAITGGGAVVGTGVASAVAFPLGFGALIGGVVGIACIIARKMYLQHEVKMQARQRMKVNYTIWSRKEKSSSAGRAYVVDTATRRF